MAAIASEIDACEQLCDEILRVAKRQPLPVGELLEAWVSTVRRSCRERDPVAALIASCMKLVQSGTPVPLQRPKTEPKDGS